MDEDEQKRCLIRATVSDFRNEKNHIPGMESELTFHKDDKIYFGSTFPKIYLNGDSFINEGYVSILIKSQLPFRASYEDFTITTIVSVIDIDRNERFSRSFSFDFCPVAGPLVSFPICRYIARKTLLNESSVLLPNNCLTVHIDMILGNFDTATEKYHKIRGDMLEGLYADMYLYKLDLSSHVGQRLCEQSSVFRDMLNFTSEREMLIELPAKEYDPFHDLCTLIMDCDYIRFGSIENLFEVYKLADKYDVQLAVETCQLLLKCLFSSKNQKIVDLVSLELHLILENAMSDEYLKEIIRNFLETNSLRTDSTGFTETNFHDTSQLVWKCDLSDLHRYPIFIFSKQSSEEFDFYS